MSVLETRRSQLSTGAVSVSGTSGVFRSVISDSAVTSISINIDGTGAVTFPVLGISASNLSLNGTSPLAGSIPGDQLLLTDAGGLKNSQLVFNLKFTSSLAVTVNGASTYCICWDEDAF